MILQLLNKLNMVPKLQLLFAQNDNFNNRNISYRGSFTCLDYKKNEIRVNKVIKAKKFQGSDRKIIFLCGSDICSHKEQLLITEKIIKEILNYGLKVDLKGHPNWDNIYPNINTKKISRLDKYIPFELIDDLQYKAIIGFGSTILARYPKKSISLLYLIKSVPIELIDKKALCLKSIHKKDDCLYPRSESDFKKIINHLLKKNDAT